MKKKRQHNVCMLFFNNIATRDSSTLYPFDIEENFAMDSFVYASASS